MTTKNFHYRRWDDNDPRLEFAVQYNFPLVVFGLCSGAKSSPGIVTYTSEALTIELVAAAAVELLSEIQLKEDKVYLPKLLQWHKKDFGATKLEMLSYFVDNISMRLLKVSKILT